MRLALHSWPGNVRELENVLGHACMMTMGDMIDAQDLPAYMHASFSEASTPGSGQGGVDESALSSETGGTLEEQERILIVRALETAGGNQSQAARILSIGRDALRYKLKKHSLESTRSERGTATGE